MAPAGAAGAVGAGPAGWPRTAKMKEPEALVKQDLRLFLAPRAELNRRPRAWESRQITKAALHGLPFCTLPARPFKGSLAIPIKKRGQACPAAEDCRTAIRTPHRAASTSAPIFNGACKSHLPKDGPGKTRRATGAEKRCGDRRGPALCRRAHKAGGARPKKRNAAERPDPPGRRRNAPTPGAEERRARRRKCRGKRARQHSDA
jgi:hypothetical protein